jgi:hypothetical protein
MYNKKCVLSLLIINNNGTLNNTSWAKPTLLEWPNFNHTSGYPVHNAPVELPPCPVLPIAHSQPVSPSPVFAGPGPVVRPASRAAGFRRWIKAAEVCYKNKTGACIAYKNLTVLLSPAASGPPFPPPPKTSVTDRRT